MGRFAHKMHADNGKTHASLFQPLRDLPKGEAGPSNLDALGELLRNVGMYGDETSATIRLVPTEGRESPLQKSMYESVQNERYLHAPPQNADPGHHLRSGR